MSQDISSAQTKDDQQDQVADSHKIQQISTSAAKEKFREKIQEMELKNKEHEVQLKAHTLGIAYVSLQGVPITPGPLSVISEEDAIRLQCICFAESTEEKRIAVIDPTRDDVQIFLKKLHDDLHAKISIYLTSQQSFDSAVKLYEKLPKIKETIHGGIKITQDDVKKYEQIIRDIKTLQSILDTKPTMSELEVLLAVLGLHTGSSDVHIEAEEGDIKIRLRIDGVLHDIGILPSSEWKHLINRLKETAQVKITITDRPQDGRLTIFFGDEKTDVRFSTLPTSYGESVVMRILRSTVAGLNFDDLGLSKYTAKALQKEIEKPNGMIITTGPTGSGKTTTLYAVLNTLNSPEVKIITLEDPVEYKLKGINQSQIDPTKGYSFASGLRSILRQDPDIVMVGEIRDLETADIAINAALTGHLVLSTIHTNSAAGAIPRFLAMGAKGFLLAPALNCMIGQRLVRRLCQSCKKEASLDAEKMERIKKELSSLSPQTGIAVNINDLHFFESRGCEQCHGIGYKGRIGIYEIMSMNQEVEEHLLAGDVSQYTLEEIAMKAGMVKMVQDGLLRALEGVTSVDEVFSVAE